MLASTTHMLQPGPHMLPSGPSSSSYDTATMMTSTMMNQGMSPMMTQMMAAGASSPTYNTNSRSTPASCARASPFPNERPRDIQRTQQYHTRGDDHSGSASDTSQSRDRATLLRHESNTERHMVRTGECQEECAEEECVDPDQCGAENRPPQPENLLCGQFDTRPMLPVSLAVSTVIGALFMMLLQLPLLSREFDVPMRLSSSGFLFLYGVTLGCMTYCTFCDPGQCKKSQDTEMNVPKRAHKSWQYKRPVRRYDHYCRWLSNCIGLMNHREFYTMLIGLACISISGTVVDLMLAVALATRGFWATELLIVLHGAYSIALLFLAGPILRIHSGLVSRNEMASEWKRNDFYVATNSKRGKDVSVNELSDDEFNSLFDSFVYDKRKNTFDRGCMKNCFSFWCISRWSSDQTGDF